VVKGVINMAILEAILSAEYLGQLTINRWHYVSTGDPGPVTSAFGLLMAMGFSPPTASPWEFTGTTIAAALQDLQVADLVYKSFYVRDLYDPTNFVETAFNPNTIGLSADVPAAPFLSYGVQSGRIRTDIARGSKRFAGVCETFMGDGGVITGSGVTKLALVATRMSATLAYTSGGASLSYAPAVLQFQEYTTPRGKKAYKKQDSAAIQLEHAALNPVYVPMPTVRSQVSRQIGRGA
jgi:hypothetical protein